MTIVHPPSLDRDTNAIESLDFAPICERQIPCDGDAATLLVVFTSHHPCGCPRKSPPTLFCDPCWVRLTTHLLHCPNCGERYHLPLSCILRVERI